MSDLIARYLAELSCDDQRSALAALQPAHVAAGTVIMRRAMRHPALLYVCAGRLAVSAGQLALAEAQPGDVVGAEQVYADPTRVFQVTAATPADIYVADELSMARMTLTQPGLARLLELSALGSLARRLDDLDSRIIARASVLLEELDPRVVHRFPLLKDLFQGHYPRSVPAAMRRTAPTSTWKEGLEGLGTLLGGFEVAEYEAGDWLATQGSPAASVQFITEGIVEVVSVISEDVLARIAVLGTDAAVGLTSVLRSSDNLASCVAAGRVRTVKIPTEQWRLLTCMDDPECSDLRVASIRALASLLPHARDLVQVSHRALRSAVQDRLYKSTPAHGALDLASSKDSGGIS